MSFSEIVSATWALSNCNLENFELNLPKLENATCMFGYSPKLTSVKLTTPKLKNASLMFYGCPKLTSVKIDLTSLENAQNMFAGGCVLDETTAKDIIDQIKNKNECEVSPVSSLSFGTKKSLQTDQEFLDLCGVPSLSNGNWFTIQNKNGISWQVQIYFQ